MDNKKRTYTFFYDNGEKKTVEKTRNEMLSKHVNDEHIMFTVAGNGDRYVFKDRFWTVTKTKGDTL